MIKSNTFFCLYLLIFTHLNSLSFDEMEIKLASGEWATYQSQKLPHGGPITVIIKKAFEEEGKTLKIDYFPWQRTYELVKDAIYTGSFLWIKTEERDKLFYFSDPIINIEDAFFHLKSYNFVWNTMDDLKDLNVGITLGYSYGDAFEKALKKNVFKVFKGTSDEGNIKNLLKGRINIFPMEIRVGLKLLKAKFTKEEQSLITYHPRSIKVVPARLMMSKKNEDHKKLIEIFNRGLKKVKANKEYEQYFLNFRKNKIQKKGEG